ncbi:hypothetical protein BK128_08450 [Viridibacillus sp. FSL H7-0596]|uniref:toll/interleukin-1 receptor domain-containing protein n=1 Tax=Viridibacillus sp. FSL H7-0596 TaxID=1928923 RepID=UPI00096DAAB3|nr:toll/interleukin-1 receptor domain-containing protein [Viridibacillus sp. FSL H7-0596]OMC87447.1 hypothetical protein BK128_08450 [Viridibacillus sp. FSL H7-0596]
MKVFLSWSGSESNQLATIFKEWLPNVLQFVEPYMSAKDISLGERWNNSITGNLQESTYGLIFVTPSNINAPWINYEAGALSKTLDSKVVPVLYNADVLILNEGPLKQFQSAKNLEKESVFSLIQSINNANQVVKLEEHRLAKAFDMWWDDLNDAINAIEKEEGTANKNGPSDKEILSVIYSKLTEQEKYLKKSDRNNDIALNVHPGLIRDLDRGFKALEMCKNELAGGAYESDFKEIIDEGLNGLRFGIQHLKRRSNYMDENGVGNNKTKTEKAAFF